MIAYTPSRGVSLQRGKRLELVQVCADLSDPATLDRELRALAQAARTQPRAVRRLLVLTRDQAPSLEAAGVSVQPAYEWLLTAPD
jgi:hypothetical protein